MPVPVKPAIDPEMLAENARSSGALQNASFASFIARLEKKKRASAYSIPAQFLMERNAALLLGGQPLYLQTDTHWRPETMEAVAQALAKSLTASGAVAGISERLTRGPQRFGCSTRKSPASAISRRC